jgi:NAD(P)-dependent dehydrogenase (short-subunit alcohol dehydrogenase family)
MGEWIKRFELTGKCALVTGATKGIGFETCKVLADAGADIAAVGRDADGLAEVAEAVRNLGRRCIAVSADMGTLDGPVRAARQAMAEFGTIDILVNNAGVALLDQLLVARVEDWDATMAVNLRAPFLLAREVVPGMIAQKRGKIINVSSQAGVAGLDSHGAYCASKGGLNMLTKVMTVEWARHNIQINTVCPTVILTPMGEKVWGQPEKGDPMLAKIPGNRFGRPIEVADMILYLSSSASDMVCGHDMMIDGGYTAV